MIELVFVACLRLSPNLCEQQSIAYTDQMSLMTCLMQAQPDLARWSETHPRHRITRWSCRHRRPDQLDA